MRVVAFVPDLLFGSSVLAALQGAGHDAVLVSGPEGLAQELAGAQVLVADLTADVDSRIDALRPHLSSGARTLAFYAHVEPEVRAQAQEAGFDLVVPRSRMAREAVALVERLAAES